MADSDDQLLTRAVQGDSAALCDLLQRYGPQVRGRLAGKIAEHWQSVLTEDDIVQVTYLEAFLEIRGFVPGGPGSFPAWLTRIAENNLRDAVKELGRAKRPPPARRVGPLRGEDSAMALWEALAADTTTPSRQVAREEVARLVEAALNRLPPDYAQVLRLYDLEGRDVSQIATAMGRSEGAVYMLRARAQDRLRELLGPGTNFFTHFA